MASANTRRKTRGQALEASVRAEMQEFGTVPTSTEEQLLRMASTLADRLDDLERSIKRDGVVIINTKGDPKTNPAAVEHRAVTASLARVLGGIYIGDSTGSAKPDARAQRAARRRWNRQNPHGATG